MSKFTIKGLEPLFIHYLSLFVSLSYPNPNPLSFHYGSPKPNLLHFRHWTLMTLKQLPLKIDLCIGVETFGFIKISWLVFAQTVFNQKS